MESQHLNTIYSELKTQFEIIKKSSTLELHYNDDSSPVKFLPECVEKYLTKIDRPKEQGALDFIRSCLGCYRESVEAIEQAFLSSIVAGHNAAVKAAEVDYSTTEKNELETMQAFESYISKIQLPDKITDATNDIKSMWSLFSELCVQHNAIVGAFESSLPKISRYTVELGVKGDETFELEQGDNIADVLKEGGAEAIVNDVEKVGPLGEVQTIKFRLDDLKHIKEYELEQLEQTVFSGAQRLASLINQSTYSEKSV